MPDLLAGGSLAGAAIRRLAILTDCVAFPRKLDDDVQRTSNIDNFRNPCLRYQPTTLPFDML